ncbi:MAG: B12-binding domain-containing radical SAM protein, partial [Planctomycetota bacterium]
MTPPTLHDRIRDELLPRVRHPAQYIGGEFNQLPRPGDWAAAEVRLALAFPDVYTIGMSHLGLQILYWIANHTPGVCAERVFHPQPDAEAVMRSARLPLFTLDTRQPVRSADVLGVSLQYELSFTSVLNLLDLAGIPLRAADRTDADPLVL